MKKLSVFTAVRIFVLLASVVLITLIAGCSGVPFALIEENYKVKPGSIAVVSGNNDEASNRLAELVTAELKKKSSFRVMSQEDIARRIPNYPFAIIKESPPSMDNQNKAWLSPGNKGRVDTVQAQLKTDYVFVLWAQNLNKLVTTSYNQYGGASTQVSFHVDIEGRFVEYPKSKPIGYSAYHGSKGQSCCLMFRSEGKDIDIMLGNSAENITEKLVEITKTEKSGK